MQCLTLDFGGTFLKYGLMDDKASLTEQGEAPSPFHSVEEFVETTGSLYDRFQDRIDGIAISMPGFLDVETGYAASAGAFLPLYGKNIYELLKERCPIPVTIENDGKSAALAEAWQGNLKGVKDGVAVLLGTGVAGGLVKNGRIHRGKNFAAGEFSFMFQGNPSSIMGSSTARCSVALLVLRAAALKGCVKDPGVYGQMLSPKVIEAMGNGRKGPTYPDLEMDGFQFFKLLEAGDPDIRALYDGYIHDLAVLCINICTIYDPQRIVIGGGISKEPRLVTDLDKALDEVPKQYGINFCRPELMPCHFRSAANLYGAMCNFLQLKGV